MELKLSAVWKPFVVISGMILLLATLKFTAFFFNPVFIGLLFVAILSPLHDWLVSRKVPHIVAVLASALAYILIYVILAWVLGLAARQILAILQQYGGAIIANNQAAIDLAKSVVGMGQALSSALESLDVTRLINVATAIARGIAELVRGVVVATVVFLFVMAELPTFMRRLRESFGEVHPVTVRTQAMLENTGRFMILRTLVNAVTGAGIALICYLMGIPSAALWGVLVFVLSYIPYLGIFIACVPPALLAFVEGGFGWMGLFVFLSTVVNWLAEQVVSPLITGKGLRISPVVVFLSSIMWGYVLGGIGFLLAVPLTMGFLLFFGAFRETAPFAALVSQIPLPETARYARVTETAESQARPQVDLPPP
jgi:predicted PurR-regulated permease PerM